MIKIHDNVLATSTMCCRKLILKIAKIKPVELLSTRQTSVLVAQW